MITTLAVVALLAGAVPVTEQPFLMVEWSDQVSFTGTYTSADAARVDAERIAACGFWRVDLTVPPPAPPAILVAPGAVRQVRLVTVSETPPLGFDRVTPPLPPQPDVETIVECAAWKARRCSVVVATKEPVQ